MKRKSTKVMLGVLVALLVIMGLQVWKPWQRQSVVFYEPLTLPIEVLEDDIIIFEDGTSLVIDRDKRINAIKYDNGKVTTESIIHINLWEYLVKSN